ncbi:50S ribosome-binding GTPase [Candidatus Pacearchaeota archaeon]|nr:50S ribosome-binding GTPase [Candidatus Pacearchaeota archaeon]
MPTKKQARSSKMLRNARKQKNKYPLLLLKVIDVSDIVLEVLDARFAKEMQNKEIEKLIEKKGKKIIYVLNKSDLTRKDEKRLNPRVLVSCRNRRGINELRDKIKIEAAKIAPKGVPSNVKVEGRNYNRVQVGVIGYPNTGKSSLINLLIGKSSAKIGAEAGFTKGIQKLRLTENIQLLDSPGVIPTEEYSMTSEEKIAKHVKVGGRSHNQVKDPELAVNAIVKSNRKNLEKFYKIKFKDSEDLIEKIGNKKGLLKKGGEVNSDRAARIVLRDWQLGIIEV